MKKVVEIVLILAGTANVAFAGVISAPEIDASAGVAAIALLTGGILVIRGRRRS